MPSYYLLPSIWYKTFLALFIAYWIRDLETISTPQYQKNAARYWEATNTKPGYQNSDSWVQPCNNEHLLRGPGVLENNGKFSRIYENLSPHKSIFMFFEVTFIDDWAAGDKLWLTISDKEDISPVTIPLITVNSQRTSWASFL